MEMTPMTALPNTPRGVHEYAVCMSTLSACQGYENCKAQHKQRASGRAQELMATGISGGTSLMKQPSQSRRRDRLLLRGVPEAIRRAPAHTGARPIILTQTESRFYLGCAKTYFISV